MTKHLILIYTLALSVAACGSDPTPVAPTPTPKPIQTPVLLAANLTIAPSGVFTCFTGLCTSLTWQITNSGPGCATGVQIIFRAYGSDGVPGAQQLGVDIPMGLPGGSLSAATWRVGTSLFVQNLGPFNDVRSAHTVFRGFVTAQTNVFC